MPRFLALFALLFFLSPVAAQSPLTYRPPPAPPPPPPPEPGFGDVAPARGPLTAGLFFGVELGLRMPEVNGSLINQVPMGPLGEFLRVPTANLPLTAAPAFELGYRLPEGAGAFILGYRFLAAEANGSATTAFDGPLQIRSRLDMQVFDLDFGTPTFEFAPLWEVSARLGGRIANVFYDSRAVNDFVEQQASNNFFGAGIHGRVDVERRLAVLPGLALFGRADGSVLTGRVRQKFHLTRFGLPSELEQSSQQTASSLNAQVGLSYVPQSLPGLKLTSGYEFEQYWNVGRLNTSDGPAGRSTGDVWSHGWFIRARFDF